MRTLIKHFKKNNQGTDYVVGDLHGMFNKLIDNLISINFDFDNDRLFSVGDLCDRGPDSALILDLLKYPWFFPVMGNHEEIILDYENKKYTQKDLTNVGAAWWLLYPNDKKQQLIQLYKELPLAIDVETDNGLVGILHAECPHADWNKLEEVLSGFFSQKMISTTLWGNMSLLNQDTIKNVKAVIVGHMTQDSYQISGNVHLIDTGAVYKDGYFTILRLKDLYPMPII